MSHLDYLTGQLHALQATLAKHEDPVHSQHIGALLRLGIENMRTAIVAESEPLRIDPAIETGIRSFVERNGGKAAEIREHMSLCVTLLRCEPDDDVITAAERLEDIAKQIGRLCN